MRIQIINGPNINLLGKREPSIYGSVTFEDYLAELRKKYADVQIDYFQSNIEGELIWLSNLDLRSGCSADWALPFPYVEPMIRNCRGKPDTVLFSPAEQCFRLCGRPRTGRPFSGADQLLLL